MRSLLVNRECAGLSDGLNLAKFAAMPCLVSP